MSKKRKKKAESKSEATARVAPRDGSEDKGTQPRRPFLRAIWMGLGAIAVAEVGWVVSSFLKPRKTQGGDAVNRTVVAGPADRFEVGSVTAFPQGRFYLVRLDDGGFLALGRECTHLSCTVAWAAEERRFLCPCHASAFDLRGDVLSPPAPRALDVYAVSIENREVKVDTGKRSRRSAFDPSQVVHV